MTAILLTGTPGSGKTTLSKYALQQGDKRFIDADEVTGLCEWREFNTGKKMGLVTDFIETGKDSWYVKYAWYWREDFLKQFLRDNPEIILCGSSENVTESYPLFDKIVVIKIEQDDLISNLADPDRNKPFGKTTQQRSNFMNWQEHLIEEAKNMEYFILEGNSTKKAYAKIKSVTGK